MRGVVSPFSDHLLPQWHHFIEVELQRRGVRFRKHAKAFLWTSDPEALQAAADRFRAPRIQKQLDYWTWVLGPKFSPKERAAINLRRAYSINQAESCSHFILKGNFSIHKIFERSCEMGLLHLTADKISQIFGFRVSQRLRGKLHTVLDKIDHGHHVLRACCKSAFVRMYEKPARRRPKAEWSEITARIRIGW